MTQQITSQRKIGLWLALSAFMVFMMMIIGAITRLTESGLSMVEWRPFIGWIPPLGDDEWMRIFDLYRQTSEYQITNKGMNLQEFQTIFWWEYIHRVWGRLIGLVYGLPFFWLLIRRAIPKGYKRHLTIILLLGVLQGVVGWWMVKSGLTARTDVSQYRLATHLGIAFVIFGSLIWIMLDFLAPVEAGRQAVNRALRWLGGITHIIIFITVLSGAVVAGIGAGLVFDDWPLMDGDFFPDGYFWRDPWWTNWFETLQTVQFNHRSMAYLTTILIICLWFAAWKYDLAPRARMSINMLSGMIFVQITLGVSTLLLVVPLYLAVAHQAGAAITFGLSIWVMKELGGQKQLAK